MEAMTMARPIQVAAAATVALFALSACGSGVANFPPPPRTADIASSVTVSANGRVITARGVIACGHTPLLVARSYRDRVTLKWVNPDTNCDAEAVKPVMVSVRLPSPLGRRHLVQASTGKRIPHRVGHGS
jgi:hypothetical protein